MIDRLNDSEEKAQMQKLIKTVTLSVALSLVGGCSYFGVYKRDLSQGNLVTQDMVAQLQPGMSRSQVESIMGSPMAPAPFDSSKWDYVFRLDKAYAGVDQRRASLTFSGDRLVDIQTSGDLTGIPDFTDQQGPGPAASEDTISTGNLIDRQTRRVSGGKAAVSEPGNPIDNTTPERP